jgi:Kef-type K+ transport system membrane component KefB
LTPFVLFVAIAMSVTAFPVLARIVAERGLLVHLVGQLVLTSAAIDDAAAWCLLAVAISIARTATLTETMISMAIGAAFTVAMIGGVRSLIAHLRPRRTVLIAMTTNLANRFVVKIITTCMTGPMVWRL